MIASFDLSFLPSFPHMQPLLFHVHDFFFNCSYMNMYIYVHIYFYNKLNFKYFIYTPLNLHTIKLMITKRNMFNCSQTVSAMYSF